jgi:hypothetical protein
VPNSPLVLPNNIFYHFLQEKQMEYVYMPLELAPQNLSQSILPNWSFNLFNVNLGASTNAALEQAALQKVGSYGKQIGHLAEALELLIGKLNILESPDLSQSEKDTLTVFLGDVAAVRKLK